MQMHRFACQIQKQPQPQHQTQTKPKPAPAQTQIQLQTQIHNQIHKHIHPHSQKESGTGLLKTSEIVENREDWGHGTDSPEKGISFGASCAGLTEDAIPYDYLFTVNNYGKLVAQQKTGLLNQPGLRFFYSLFMPSMKCGRA